MHGHLDEGSARDRVIARFGLEAHPEGGWFRRTWTDPVTDDDGRARGSSILYLLRSGEVSHWHRIDATEVWHHVGGAPLELTCWAEGDTAPTRAVLGADADDGEVPQSVVPPAVWQSARSLGAWSLVGCVVVPEFSFDGWELAAPDWAPPVG